jgi:hypothetical protein
MKLVRFGDRRTGLVVDLEARLHIIDVVASVGALLPHVPISNGVLNGILREGGRRLSNTGLTPAPASGG